MTAQKVLTVEVIEAIQRTLDYQWAAEKQDYESHADDVNYCQRHIFRSLQRVAEWLDYEPEA